MRRAYYVGGIWAATLVVTAAATWKISSSALPVSGDDTRTSMTHHQPERPEASNRRADSADELSFLRDELENLKVSYLALSKDYFALSLARWVVENRSIDTDPESIVDLWDRQLDAIRRGNDSFSIESRFGLMFAFTTYGDAGVGHLNQIINDRNRSLSERETALLVLRYMATPRAFETLLSFRDPGLTQLDYPYDLISFQLKMIQTDAIRHHFPGILAQIDKDLGVDDYSPERVEVLLTLASTHGNARAQQLLHDPRRDDESLGGAITLAATLDTAVADEFLLDLAQNHEDEHVRMMARDAYGQ